MLIFYFAQTMEVRMLRISGMFIASLFVLLMSFTAFAQETTTTVVEKKVVVTPPPKSVNCTAIPAHWEGDTWVDTQNICRYENRVEGVAWVQDYWACTAATATGDCTTWEFRPGHWVKTLPQ